MRAFPSAGRPTSATSAVGLRSPITVFCGVGVLGAVVAVFRLYHKPGSGDAFVAPPALTDEHTSRRHTLSLGMTAALGTLPALASEAAWAADANPWPYDISRGKIAKKLAPFTASACPDPLLKVQLGDDKDALRFIPDSLELVQGCYYEMALSNPSSMEHNFVALEFAKSVYSIVVLAGSPPAELKGQTLELELKAGASLGWFFVPVKAGDFELKCTVAGHTEGGMVGRVKVVPRSA